jgi:hypothetical protein
VVERKVIGQNAYNTLKTVERQGGTVTKESFAASLIAPYTAANKLAGACRTGYLVRIRDEFQLTDKGARAIRVYEQYGRENGS